MLDQISEGKGINLPDGDRGENTEKSRGEMKTESDMPPLQKQDGMVITGTDVTALFPSITDVEAGRIVREAVEESIASIESVDYRKP